MSHPCLPQAGADNENHSLKRSDHGRLCKMDLDVEAFPLEDNRSLFHSNGTGYHHLQR